MESLADVIHKRVVKAAMNYSHFTLTEHFVWNAFHALEEDKNVLICANFVWQEQVLIVLKFTGSWFGQLFRAVFVYLLLMIFLNHVCLHSTMV